MDRTTPIIRLKTEAWENPESNIGVLCARSPAPVVRKLYDHLEEKLIQQFATGNRILDVGIGAGRASLALARAGRQVTGLDCSPRMLDECRRQAKGCSLELTLGDLHNLPFPSGQFDTLLAMDVLTHYPDWAEILAGWRDKVAADGRILFDLHSLDHLRYIRQAPLTAADLLDEQAGQNPLAFRAHASVAEVIEQANRLGLSIETIVPYGLLDNSSRYQHPFTGKALADAYWWRRHLTWLAEDNVYRFCEFLEYFLFRLTPVMTGRFLTVLRNRPDEARNRAWLKKHRQLSGLILQNFTPDALAPWLPFSLEQWKRALHQFMTQDHRNFYTFFFFWICFWKQPDRVALDSFLDPNHARSLQDWWQREQINFKTLTIARNWYLQPAIAQRLDFMGINLGAGMEYPLIPRILQDYFAR